MKGKGRERTGGEPGEEVWKQRKGKDGKGYKKPSRKEWRKGGQKKGKGGKEFDGPTSNYAPGIHSVFSRLVLRLICQIRYKSLKAEYGSAHV